MSAHSTAIEVSSKRGVWGGGNEPLKASYGKLMMWFFLLSDIFTFAAFLITYLAIRVSYPAYAGAAETFTGSNEYWPVPELVFALIFVVAFSLGPLPGILALAIHTAGALGKLFAEVVENIDMKPVDGVVATGGNWFHKIRFAVLPQVASNFASYALLRFEINVRGASVLGFVGAGGIGQTLLEVIRKFYYADVSALLIMIIATVMVIDAVTERIRHKLIGLEAKS